MEKKQKLVTLSQVIAFTALIALFCTWVLVRDKEKRYYPVQAEVQGVMYSEKDTYVVVSKDTDNMLIAFTVDTEEATKWNKKDTVLFILDSYNTTVKEDDRIVTIKKLEKN